MQLVARPAVGYQRIVPLHRISYAVVGGTLHDNLTVLCVSRYRYAAVHLRVFQSPRLRKVIHTKELRVRIRVAVLLIFNLSQLRVQVVE